MTEAIKRKCDKCSKVFTPYGFNLRCPFCGWNCMTGKHEPETITTTSNKTEIISGGNCNDRTKNM